MDFGKKNRRRGPCGPGMVLSKNSRGRLCVKAKPKKETRMELVEQARRLGLSITKKKNGLTVPADKTTLKRRITSAIRRSNLNLFGRAYKYKKGLTNKRLSPCPPGLKRSKYQKGRLCVKDLPKVTTLELRAQARRLGLSVHKKKKDGSPSKTFANKRTLKLRITNYLRN